MALIVDASVAFKWFVPERDDEAALALLDSNETLCAPDLIFAEVANAMWSRLQGIDAAAGTVAEAQLQLRRILSDLFRAEALVSRAAEIAFEIGDSVYDCIYLAACERERLTMITADTRLVSKMADTAFAKLVKPLA